MSRVLPSGAGLILTALCGLGAAPGGIQPAAGRPDAGGMPAPTPDLERGRHVYVLNTCHFCHGVDLAKAQMGAAVLMYSALVGADENGSIIGPIVRAGFPNLQTSMPSYPDLTEQEIRDLAAYIHYLRQVGRHRELSKAALAPGDAAAGREYFDATCASCHAVGGDLAGVAARQDAASLRARILGAPPPAEPGAGAGRRQHLRLLELYRDEDVRNLVAYLQQAAR